MTQGASAALVAICATALWGSAGASPPAGAVGGGGRSGRCSDVHSHPQKMPCGPGVPLCGVLTLEMGTGSGAYKHSDAVVHGLWPQVGKYGDSKCVPPRNSSSPQKVYDCYDQKGVPHEHVVAFQLHEWKKHGVCAGVVDADDFFNQICSLSAGPLQVVEAARVAGMDIVDTVDQLHRSGHCVYKTDSMKEISLSACAAADGRWKLADVGDFGRLCASKGPQPPTPQPNATCMPSHRGPPCASDADCSGVDGCVRCAKSGYCTNIPLEEIILA